MDHDNAMDGELDQLLDRATVSALTTLTTDIDVARRLLELHDSPDPPPSDGRDGSVP